MTGRRDGGGDVMSLPQRVIVATGAGVLFAWAMSTRLPTYSALFSGVAAAVFVVVSITVIERQEQRIRARRAAAAADQDTGGMA